MALHKLVGPLAVGVLLMLGGASAADDVAKPNTLTPKEIADGWLLLFDGETTFGWKPVESRGGKKAELSVKDGVFSVSGGRMQLEVQFRLYELKGEYRCVDATGQFAVMPHIGKSAAGFEMSGGMTPGSKDEWVPFTSSCQPTMFDAFSRAGKSTVTISGSSQRHDSIRIQVGTEGNGRVELRNLKVRPLGLTRIFNGKDLTGWKKYTGDAKREKSEFSVTPAGELSLKNGPGDLQSEKEFDDFVLQLECKTNGTALNSGVFLRCLPGQYQQGYEAQIQNAFLNGDRTKPMDFGTGAIYRRVPARKVVSNDKEWFTMTVLARGPHFATWVNGYPVVSWTDERKPAENGRNGLYTKKGPISIQGHDPTTDLLFRNIRIAELKAQ